MHARSSCQVLLRVSSGVILSKLGTVICASGDRPHVASSCNGAFSLRLKFKFTAFWVKSASAHKSCLDRLRSLAEFPAMRVQIIGLFLLRQARMANWKKRPISRTRSLEFDGSACRRPAHSWDAYQRREATENWAPTILQAVVRRSM